MKIYADIFTQILLIQNDKNVEVTMVISLVHNQHETRKLLLKGIQ